MIDNKKILAIIPARKGSKRLPRKNKLKILGKPLICWTIEASVQSKYIDTILVSTDDDEIIDIAKEYNIKVPFKRPSEISSDEATMNDVIIHAINFFKTNGESYDIIILLQPTSPLRTTNDIDKALELISEKNESVISVCENSHSPLWSNVLPKDNSMEFFIKDEFKGVRSQDLPKFYCLNGAIFISTVNYFLKHNDFIGPKSIAYIMDKKRSIDIDSKLDFEFCNFLLNESN